MRISWQTQWIPANTMGEYYVWHDANQYSGFRLPSCMKVNNLAVTLQPSTRQLLTFIRRWYNGNYEHQIPASPMGHVWDCSRTYSFTYWKLIDLSAGLPTTPLITDTQTFIGLVTVILCSKQFRRERLETQVDGRTLPSALSPFFAVDNKRDDAHEGLLEYFQENLNELDYRRSAWNYMRQLHYLDVIKPKSSCALEQFCFIP